MDFRLWYCLHFAVIISLKLKGYRHSKKITYKEKHSKEIQRKREKGENSKKLKEIITDSIFANFETTLRFSSLNDCF